MDFLQPQKKLRQFSFIPLPCKIAYFSRQLKCDKHIAKLSTLIGNINICLSATGEEDDDAEVFSLSIFLTSKVDVQNMDG